MQVRKLFASVAIAGGLSSAAMALGAGTAGADPKWWEPVPPPGHVVPPPGHIGQAVGIPPGHIGQWVGVPPGHWDKPWKWVR
ncbi:hypothetical protein [Mycobacterium sp. SMC-4]|uniref:hypothetical protein n=1 Tax=Mycobacterium sp. SMC-4 TaxID=2857059 RepID=UPI0021B2A7B0|nr:hypothetical protein [Mycobacterium sp. SMC-4]UXA16753.1 hypothetical protein KXD98_18475 [Mycobacterium sp. SMC-4]